MMTAAYERSCYLLKKELDAAGMPHDFLRITNESLITRARNVIATSFLNDTNFECLLFVDADIEFDPADVARLWNLCAGGAFVAVGHYRHKNPDAKDEVWVNHRLVPISDFKEPFEVTYAGTGFMMIRRKTFLNLQVAHPHWKYEEGFPEPETRNWDAPVRPCWAFFQDPIVDVGGRLDRIPRVHLSEDYFFCKSVQEQGMRVMMDPEIKLKHWGMYAY